VVVDSVIVVVVDVVVDGLVAARSSGCVSMSDG
jgi:hypothetical protein